MHFAQSSHTYRAVSCINKGEKKKECKRFWNFHIEIVNISGCYEVLECSLCRHDNWCMAKMADACPSCCLGCVVCTSFYSRMCAATTPQVPFTTSTFPIIYFVSRNQYFSWALLSIFLETTEKNAYAKFLRGQTKCIMWMQKRWIFYPGALPFDGERSSELGNSTQASISDWLSFERMK